jgi:hypothetical protein
MRAIDRLVTTAAGARLRALWWASALYPGGPVHLTARIPFGDVIGIGAELAP